MTDAIAGRRLDTSEIRDLLASARPAETPPRPRLIEAIAIATARIAAEDRRPQP
jgi:uncharacterized membrane protein